MDEREPAVTTLEPWFGGKRTLASEICAELGPHDSYYNLACGGLAVEFRKKISSHETLNELHGGLINLARVVASDRAPELYDRLQRTLVHEGVLADSVAWLEQALDPPEWNGTPWPGADCGCTDLHIEHAYNRFIQSWMGRNGVAGLEREAFQIAVRWTPGGGAGGVRFVSAVDGIPWWHRRLRAATIINRDLFDIIGLIADVEGVAIYLDPPYMRDGKKRTGGSAYRFEFTPKDHVRLAIEARRFKHARVVISYYDLPEVDRLYPLWHKRTFTVQKKLARQNERGPADDFVTEALYMNGPALAGESVQLPDGPEPTLREEGLLWQ